MEREIIVKIVANVAKAYYEEHFGVWSENDYAENVGFFVDSVCDNPKLSAAEYHSSWVKKMADNGWGYGAQFDLEKKQHPYFKEFKDLPVEWRSQMAAYRELVLNLIDINIMRPDPSPVELPSKNQEVTS